MDPGEYSCLKICLLNFETYSYPKKPFLQIHTHVIYFFRPSIISRKSNGRYYVSALAQIKLHIANEYSANKMVYHWLNLQLYLGPKTLHFSDNGVTQPFSFQAKNLESFLSSSLSSQTSYRILSQVCQPLLLLTISSARAFSRLSQ